MNIFFLNHSGFALEDEKRIYIFDYNEDPQGHVKRLAKEGKPLWFFVTHVHGDHFNPLILKFASPTTKYFYHSDVKPGTICQSESHSMQVGDTLTIEGVHIQMYGSTDEGGSFLVKTEGESIFHSGDLNWWHWLGDTKENNDEAKANFKRELARLNYLEADYVFFPVDARLEEAREWGVLEFLRVAKVNKLLVPMHYFGAPWTPSSYYMALYEEIPVWIPEEEGQVFNS